MYQDYEWNALIDQLEVVETSLTGGKQCHRIILVNAKRNTDGTPVSAEVAPYRGWIYMDGNLLLKGPSHADQVFGFIEDGKVNGRDVSDCSFRYLSEGTIIRVLLLEGELYITTNRTMDCSRSRYGKSDTFDSLFLSSLDTDREKLQKLLFKNQVTSKYAYLFVVNHHQLMVASKVAPLGAVYIGHIELNVEGVDTADFEETVSDAFSVSSISMEEATRYLHCGGHHLESEWTQEPVLAIYPDGQQLKIIPPGYKKRLDLVTNDPNCRLVMCRLLELSYPNIPQIGKQNERTYYDRYLCLKLPEDYTDYPTETELMDWMNDLDDTVIIPPLSVAKCVVNGSPENQENRFRRLITALAFSVHPSRRNEVIEAGLEFIEKRRKFIIKLVEDPDCVNSIVQLTDSKGKPLDKDGKNIIRLQQIVDHARKGGHDHYAANIRSIINIESGNSLQNLMLRFDVDRLQSRAGSSR